MLLLQRLKLEMPVTGCLPPAFRSTSSYMKVRRPVYIITTSPPPLWRGANYCYQRVCPLAYLNTMSKLYDIFVHVICGHSSFLP